MMQGITSLPGAQQAPGQAAPFNAMPPQQPMTPQAMTGQLQNLPPQQLLQMFANPADKTPKWAVVTAYAKAVEQQRLQEMVRGQQAMQQGQMQAQQPPVAAQVMSQPMAAPQSREQMLRRGLEEATQRGDMNSVSRLLEQLKALEAEEFRAPERKEFRHGGVMHGYAGGGAVAFQSGGNPEVERILKKSPYQRTAEENEILRASGVELARRSLPEGGISALNRALEGPFLRRMFTGDAYKLSPEELEKRQDVGAITENIVRALGGSQVVEPTVEPKTKASEEARMAALMAPAAGAWAKRTAGVPDERFKDDQTRTRPGGVGDVAKMAAPMRATAAELSPEMRAVYEARKAELQKRLIRPESLVKAEEGLAALARSGIEAQRGEVESARKEATEALEAARKRREVSPLEDLTFLGQMLEGMRGSKRFGEALAGAASGAGRATATREAAMREAEKEHRASQRETRAMQANLRQTELLEGQRQVALERGKLDEVNAINDQLSNLAQKREEFRIARGDVAFNQAVQARQVDVQERTLLEKAKQTRLIAEQQGNTKLATAISAAQARVQQARNNIGSVVESAVGKTQAAMYNLDPEKFAKDQPVLFGKIQTAMKDYQTKVIKPADDQLNSLLNQASSLGSGGQKVIDFGSI